MKKHRQDRPSSRGFTLIEMIVVIGIMGIFMLVSYPSICHGSTIAYTGGRSPSPNGPSNSSSWLMIACALR